MITLQFLKIESGLLSVRAQLQGSELLLVPGILGGVLVPHSHAGLQTVFLDLYLVSNIGAVVLQACLVVQHVLGKPGVHDGLLALVCFTQLLQTLALCLLFCSLTLLAFLLFFLLVCSRTVGGLGSGTVLCVFFRIVTFQYLSLISHRFRNLLAEVDNLLRILLDALHYIQLLVIFGCLLLVLTGNLLLESCFRNTSLGLRALRLYPTGNARPSLRYTFTGLSHPLFVLQVGLELLSLDVFNLFLSSLKTVLFEQQRIVCFKGTGVFIIFTRGLIKLAIVTWFYFIEFLDGLLAFVQLLILIPRLFYQA